MIVACVLALGENPSSKRDSRQVLPFRGQPVSLYRSRQLPFYDQNPIESTKSFNPASVPHYYPFYPNYHRYERPQLTASEMAIDHQIGVLLKTILFESHPLRGKSVQPFTPMEGQMNDEQEFETELAEFINSYVNQLRLDEKVNVLTEYSSVFNQPDNNQRSIGSFPVDDEGYRQDVVEFDFYLPHNKGNIQFND